MVYASADTRQNQTVDEYFGPESHYADDVSETGENEECYYAIEREHVCCGEREKQENDNNRKRDRARSSSLIARFIFNPNIFDLNFLNFFFVSQNTNELSRKLESSYAESSSGISSGASSPTNTNKPIKGRFAGVWSRLKTNSIQRRLFH